MRLLLDPGLADLPVKNELTSHEVRQFWLRLLEWAKDERLLVGTQGQALVSKLVVDAHIYSSTPSADVPNFGGLPRQDLAKAIGCLFGKIQGPSQTIPPKKLDARYIGSSDARDALFADLGTTLISSIVGIATTPEHWKPETGAVVKVLPAPPSNLELCTQPGVVSQSEQKSVLHEFFAVRSLIIVSGLSPRVEERVRRMLSEELGVKEAHIKFIRSERHKVPRNLAQQFKHLSGTENIVVCLTGKLGHATSQRVEAAAKRFGVPLILAEDEDTAVPVLKKLAHNAML